MAEKLSSIFTDKYQAPKLIVKFRYKGTTYDLRTIDDKQLKKLEESEWPHLKPVSEVKTAKKSSKTKEDEDDAA